MFAVFYALAPWDFTLTNITAVAYSGVPWFLGGVTLYYALYRQDVSITSGLQNLKLLFVVIFANIILGEQFSLVVYILIGLLIISSFLVAVDEKIEWKDFFNWPIAIFILSLVLFSLSDVMAKRAFALISPISLMSGNILVGFVLSLFLLPFVFSKINQITWPQARVITINSMLTFSIVCLLIIAFQDNVTISNVLTNLTGPFALMLTVVLSKFKPNLIEKHTPRVFKIRMVGVLVSYVLAALIVFLS